MKLSNQLYLVLSGFLVGAACFLLFVSLIHGVGVSSDSVAYIKAASEFRNGGGVASLPNHWPPLYPITLSVVGMFGNDDLFAIRLFHSALYGINIFLIPYLCVPKSRNDNIIRLTLSLFLLASPQLFEIHQMAWSEPLFLALSFTGLAFLRSNSSKKVWYYSAFFLGLATITRYAGLYFIVMAALWVAYFTSGNLLRKFKIAISYTTVAILPLLINSVLNNLVAGSSTNRTLAFHPATFEHIKLLTDLFSGWFTPFNQGYLGLSLLLLTPLLLTYHLLTLKKSAQDKNSQHVINQNWASFMIIVAAGYIGFILFSVSFIDAYTPISERIFTPTYVALWIGLSCWLLSKQKAVSITILLILLPVGISNIFETSRVITKSIENGVGYFTVGSDKMRLLDVTKQLAKGRKIYTNAEDFLYIHRGIHANQFPKVYSPASLQGTPGFQQKLLIASKEIQDGEAIAVFFSGFLWRKYYPSPQTVYELSKVNPIYSQKDGMIIGLPTE